MQRRKFISILAGLVAAIPFVGSLVKKPEDAFTLADFKRIESQIMNHHRGKTDIPDAIYLKELPPIEGRTVAIPFQEEVTGLPTYGDHPVPLEAFKDW